MESTLEKIIDQLKLDKTILHCPICNSISDIKTDIYDKQDMINYYCTWMIPGQYSHAFSATIFNNNIDELFATFNFYDLNNNIIAVEQTKNITTIGNVIYSDKKKDSLTILDYFPLDFSIMKNYHQIKDFCESYINLLA